MIIAGGGSGGAPAGPSYLLAETFEGSTACGDGVDSNCDVTWTELAGDGTSDFSYTAAAINGTNSLQMEKTSTDPIGWGHSIDAIGTLYFFYKINHEVLVGGANQVRVMNNSTNLMIINNANTEFKAICGTSNTYSTSTSQGTTYYVWGKYTKGTGSDAVCQVWHSTTSTKPGSPNIDISDGESTLDANFFELSVSHTGAKQVYDDIYLDDEDITGEP